MISSTTEIVDKSISFLACRAEAERQLDFEKSFENLYIEHKGGLLKVQVREDKDKLLFRKCKYGCGQLENPDIYCYKRTHLIKSWYIAWELFDDLSPYRKHDCPKKSELRRNLK
jgi:hypothetical protein